MAQHNAVVSTQQRQQQQRQASLNSSTAVAIINSNNASVNSGNGVNNTSTRPTPNNSDGLPGCIAIRFRLHPWAEESALFDFIAEALSPPPHGISGVEVVRAPDSSYVVRMKYDGFASMQSCVRRTTATPFVRKMSETVIDRSTFEFWAGTNMSAPPEFDPLRATTTTLDEYLSSAATRDSGDFLDDMAAADRSFASVSGEPDSPCSDADGVVPPPLLGDGVVSFVPKNDSPNGSLDSQEADERHETSVSPAGGLSLVPSAAHHDGDVDNYVEEDCADQLPIPARSTSATSIAVHAPSRVVSDTASRAGSPLVVFPPRVGYFWADSCHRPSGTAYHTGDGDYVLLFSALPRPHQDFATPALHLRMPSRASSFFARSGGTSLAAFAPRCHQPYDAKPRLVCAPPAAAAAVIAAAAPTSRHALEGGTVAASEATPHLGQYRVSDASQNATSTTAANTSVPQPRGTAAGRPRSMCVLATLQSGHMKRCRCDAVDFPQPVVGDQVLVQLPSSSSSPSGSADDVRPPAYIATVAAVATWSRRKSAKNGGSEGHATVLRTVSAADAEFIRNTVVPRSNAVRDAAAHAVAQTGAPVHVHAAWCTFDLGSVTVSLTIRDGASHEVGQRALGDLRARLAASMSQRVNFSIAPPSAAAAAKLAPRGPH